MDSASGCLRQNCFQGQRIPISPPWQDIFLETLSNQSMLGDIFQILGHQNGQKDYLISPPWLEKFLDFRSLEWLETLSNQSTMLGEIFQILGHQNGQKHYLISPPWLEKFLDFRSLEWLETLSNQSIMVGEIFRFQVFLSILAKNNFCSFQKYFFL